MVLYPTEQTRSTRVTEGVELNYLERTVVPDKVNNCMIQRHHRSKFILNKLLCLFCDKVFLVDKIYVCFGTLLREGCEFLVKDKAS